MFNRLYSSKLYPLLFQIGTLIVFVLLIIGGFGITTEESVFAKQLRNTNLSNLIVWSYWWPLIIISAVLFGRHWCSVCPVEFISAFVSRIGLKLRVPGFIKSSWVITFLYAFIAVIAVHTWGIHRIPNLMALYLIALLGLAILVSLVFEKRAFCSYFCPVGKLLGLYSLISPWGLRANRGVCRSCETMDCVLKENRYKLIGRSCTSELYPPNISDNRSCILCTQCVKVCPNDNIKLRGGLKSYFSFNLNKFSAAEVGIVSILIGFVCYEILSSWTYSKTVLLALPQWLSELLSIEDISYKMFEAVVLFLVLPALLLLFVSGIAKIGGRGLLWFYVKRTCGYILPIIAFGHVFKSLIKMVSRIPYWKYALEKPNGLYYAKQIVDKEIVLNHTEWFSTVVVLLCVIALFFALGLSLKKVMIDKEISRKSKGVYFLFVLTYFLILVFGPSSEYIT